MIRRHRRNPDGPRVRRPVSAVRQLTGKAGRIQVGDIVAFDNGIHLGVVQGAAPGAVLIEQVRGSLRQFEQALNKYRAFYGVEPDSVEVTPEPPQLGVMFELGDVLEIAYQPKAGERAKFSYLHKIRRASRPKLLVAADGKTLVIHGGAVEVTAHGIEDR